MTRPTRLVPLLSLAVLATAAPAEAVVASLSLTQPSAVAAGDPVTIQGTAPGASDGDPVELIDAGSEAVLAGPVAVAGEQFSFTFAPSRNVQVRARSVDMPSVRSDPPVAVSVIPMVSVALADVRLFGDALISGTVQPAIYSGQAVVQLRNGSGVLNERTINVSGGAFSTRLRVTKPGAQFARVRLIETPDFLEAGADSSSKAPPLPNLRSGSRGIYVLLLERRLRELSYKAPKPDRRFTFKTGDAVMAFRKVQRQRRSRNVGAATWIALASPRIPQAKFASPRFHIEVDQSRQVLYIVREGQIRKILHVSTGGPGVGVTRNGRFRVWLKFPGFSPKGLYMPAFFDGQRGIHGWPQVPPVPASHGCVRVPMWTAKWIYKQVRVGTVVRIYGRRR
ncbi:MAG TPA: L,D-transpeptidase [Actinomycetota bacterium]|nr:L,D-transpeptidase [Actinomycetota bacterium]